MLEVEASHRLITERITLFKNNGIVAIKQWHEINRDLFYIVDFTTRQRIHGSLGVCHCNPAHLVNIDDLAACHPAGWLVARDIIFILEIADANTGLELCRYELERT